jgi:hypothetical protein
MAVSRDVIVPTLIDLDLQNGFRPEGLPSVTVTREWRRVRFATWHREQSSAPL